MSYVKFVFIKKYMIYIHFLGKKFLVQKNLIYTIYYLLLYYCASIYYNIKFTTPLADTIFPKNIFYINIIIFKYNILYMYIYKIFIKNKTFYSFLSIFHHNFSHYLGDTVIIYFSGWNSCFGKVDSKKKSNYHTNMYGGGNGNDFNHFGGVDTGNDNFWNGSGGDDSSPADVFSNVNDVSSGGFINSSGGGFDSGGSGGGSGAIFSSGGGSGFDSSGGSGGFDSGDGGCGGDGGCCD